MLHGYKGYEGGKIKYEPSIFVSNSKKILFFNWINPWGINIDVWQIEDDQPLFRDIFMHNEGHYYLKEPVPPSKLRLIKCY